MKQDVAVLILGASAGSYAAGRSFYTEFGICPTVLDTAVPSLFFHSRFVCAKEIPSFDLSYPALCLRILEDEREALGRRVLLLPATPLYAEFLLREEEALSPLFILPFGQAPVYPYETKEEEASGFLVACLDGKETPLFCYAKAPLYQNGRPLYFRTEAIPEGLFPLCRSLHGQAQGIFTFPVWEREGTFLIGAPAADLSALPFFGAAADRSPAEFLLFRHILSESVPERETPEDGLYLLSSKGRILRLLKDEEERERFLALYRKKWEISLFGGKEERLDPICLLAKKQAMRRYGKGF